MRASHFFTHPFTGGQPVEQWGAVVNEAGLVNDRVLVAYDSSNVIGEVDGAPVYERVSQAQVRQLAQITPVLGLKGAKLLHYGTGAGIDVQTDTAEGKTIYVNEFGDRTPVFDAGNEAASFLEEVTGSKTLRIGEKTPEWRAGGLISPSLRRNAAVHIISAVSLRALEDMLGEPIDPRRFRPNIILDDSIDSEGSVDGIKLEPFAELKWIGRVLQIGNQDKGAAYQIDGVTKRCNVPGNHVLTGKNMRDVPRIYNRIPGKKVGQVAVFGLYAHPVGLRDGQKTITRNDRVAFTRRFAGTDIAAAVTSPE